MKTKAPHALFFLILASVFSKAHATWPSSVRESWLSYHGLAEGLGNTAVATFWGGFRRYRFITRNKAQQDFLPSPLFGSGAFPYYLSGDAHSERLFVFMPGIFGQPTSGLTPQFVDMLESIGGSVLVVPNLLAPDYVRAYPLYGADLVALEVAVMESALDHALGQLPQVRRVHVIAESLGTAIGSAWAAHDRSHRRRLSDLTLLWPPLDLPRAMKNFDAIIDQHRPFARTCGLTDKLAVLLGHFLWSAFPGKLTAAQAGCVGAMVMVDGFISATQRSWHAYREVAQLTGDPPEGFEAYFRAYRPELWQLIERNDERLTLAHWLKRIKSDQTFPIRIATSQDDFLNRGLSWEKLRRDVSLRDDEILLHSWGGHSGPVSVPGMHKFLRKLYGTGALARQAEAPVAPRDARVPR